MRKLIAGPGLALRCAGRVLWAFLTVDFVYWGRIREQLGRAHIFRTIIVLLVALGALLGGLAVRKKQGAIHRSHLLGQRFWEIASNKAQMRANLELTRTNERPSRQSLRTLRDSYNVYEPRALHRPYPVTFGMFFAPLSRLDLTVLRALWYVMQICLLCWLGWIFDRLACEWFSNWPRYRWAALGLTLLWSSRFLQRDFAGGQVNLLQFALCIGTLYLVSCGRRWSAGLPLGLAVSLKLTPVLLVIYLLYRRHWRPALVSLLLSGILFALPSLLIGNDVHQENLSYWYQGVRQMTDNQDLFENRADKVIVPFSFGNQSLRYALFRFLSTYPQVREDRPAWGYIDFLNLPPAKAQRVIRAALAILLLFTALMFGWQRPDPRTLPFYVEGAIVFGLMLALSPITWKSHYVFLLLGFFLLIAYGCCLQHKTIWRYMIAFFVLCVALNRNVLGRTIEDLHLAYYLNTLGLLVVLAGLFHLLRLARITHFNIVGLPAGTQSHKIHGVEQSTKVAPRERPV